MKILALILVLLLCSLIAASAFPDSVFVGPYKVSFDIGLNKTDYMTNISEPKYSEYLNGEKYKEWTLIIADKHIAAVIITENERSLFSNVDYEKLVQDSTNTLYVKQHATRIIDGVNGGVADIQPIGEERHYNAGYSPSCCNLTGAFIVSYYPWDSGTLQLLKTIHIEKVN